MISILSAVVLMVAIGTVIQRADLFSVDDGPAIALNTDVVEARGNRLLRIDVLQNDEGISAEDRQRLALIGQPICGQVFVQDEALQYLPDASCSGQQVIQYGIEGRDGVVGQVVAKMVGLPNNAAQQPAQTPQVVAAAPQQQVVQAEPDRADASASEGAKAPNGTEQTDTATDVGLPANVPGVVETLIAGAAQPAQAAVAPVDEAAQAVDPKPEPIVQEQPELVEPTRSLIATAALDAPSDASNGSQVTSGPASNQVVRTPLGPKVSDSATPATAEIEKPLRRIATPTLEVRTPETQRSVETQDSFDLAGIDGVEPAPNRSAPLDASGDIEASDDTGFLIAVVSRKEPVTTPPDGLRLAPAHEASLQSATGSAPDLPEIASSETQLTRPSPLIDAPDSGLSAALPSSPVDASQPSLTASPVISSSPPKARPVLAAVGDATQSVAPGNVELQALPADRNAPRSPESPEADQLAALPRHDAPCVVPPAMTIDVRRAARSIISIDAPCHADTVAELKYSSLRLAVPLDGKGRGAQMVLGFEPNAPALLTFVNGETIDFDLPFKGIGRISRVALVWDMPVSLELNAIEFGAETGSEFHIRPDNPRSFEDVRRSGGGFLNAFRSFAGIGQNAQIYSFYHRRGGQQGVVELMIDYASRNRDLLDGTCGDGKFAAPNFLILRSEDARLERPIIRKLSALNCSSVAEEKGDKRLITGAVSDLLVVQR